MSKPDKTINKEQLMMQIIKKMIMTMIADININTLTDINITKILTEQAAIYTLSDATYQIIVT